MWFFFFLFDFHITLSEESFGHNYVFQLVPLRAPFPTALVGGISPRVRTVSASHGLTSVTVNGTAEMGQMRKTVVSVWSAAIINWETCCFEKTSAVRLILPEHYMVWFYTTVELAPHMLGEYSSV